MIEWSRNGANLMPLDHMAANRLSAVEDLKQPLREIRMAPSEDIDRLAHFV
jgi:hypothetical protein